MSTQDKTTADHAHGKRHGSSIGGKVSGLANIIHGTGEIIRGQAVPGGDRSHDSGKAIAAAGRDEVQRGLDKLEGKPTTTPTASNTGGADDGTEAAFGPHPTAPSQPSAAAPRPPDASAEKIKEDTAADASYPVEKGTAGTTGGDSRAWWSERNRDEQGQSAVPTSSHDRSATTDGAGAQQQDSAVGSMTADRDKQPPVSAPQSSNAPAQKEPSGTAAPD